MRKVEYTLAVEYCDELIAFYKAAARDYRQRSIEATTYEQSKDLDNQADGCDGVLNRLEHVRSVVLDAQKRTGARWVTRVTS